MPPSLPDALLHVESPLAGTPVSSPVGRFLAHHRVQHFRCGQAKDQAFPNRGRPAADFAFIQLNPADWLNFLVVDVDREDALMCLMHPVPGAQPGRRSAGRARVVEHPEHSLVLG